MNTLIQIWNTYKADIIPALVSALIAFLPFFVFWVRNRLTLSNKKQEAQLEVMKEIANKEDTTPELEAIEQELAETKEELKELKDSISNMASLFNTAFQGSDLSPEIKESLEHLKNKVIIGNSQDLISELEEKLKEANERCESLLAEKNNLLANKAEEVVSTVSSKIRKIRR